MTDLPVSRRRFLATAALTAGSVALTPAAGARRAAAVPPQVTLPERGIYDASAATAWTDGFLTGNGEYGAVLYGTPTLEKVIFNHHRFVLPNGSRGVTPPVISGRLAGVRDKALAGNYGGANTDFAAGWSLRWTQTYHPGFELQISTPGMTTANGYARITDFRTGEVTSTWTDSNGTWTRRAFASRADKVVVHELTPAPGRSIDATLSVNTSLAGVPGSVRFTTLASVIDGSGYLNLRGTYPSGQGAFGFEGVTRVVATGGTVTANGSTIVVTAATRLLLLTKLDRYESPTAWDSKPLHAALATVSADYGALRTRHVALHSAMYDRSRLDLNVSAADRQLSTTRADRPAERQPQHHGSGPAGTALRQRPLPVHQLQRGTAAAADGNLGRHVERRLGRRFHHRRQHQPPGRRRQHSRPHRCHAGLLQPDPRPTRPLAHQRPEPVRRPRLPGPIANRRRVRVHAALRPRLPRPMLDRWRRLAALPAAGVLPDHRGPDVSGRQAGPGADGAGPVLRGLPDPHRLGRPRGVRAVILDGELAGQHERPPGDQCHRRHSGRQTRPAGGRRRGQRARCRTGRRPRRRTLDSPAGEAPALHRQRQRRPRRMVLAGPHGSLQPSARPSPVRRVATARNQSRGGTRAGHRRASGPGATR